MQVSYQPPVGVIHSLEDTIDYAVLFGIINTTMQKPVDLLETLTQTIAENSYKQFPQIKEITVTVEKLNPPIDKFSGSVQVKYSKKY
jgi:dihydroneopterin aldolase